MAPWNGPNYLLLIYGKAMCETENFAQNKSLGRYSKVRNSHRSVVDDMPLQCMMNLGKMLDCSKLYNALYITVLRLY